MCSPLDVVASSMKTHHTTTRWVGTLMDTAGVSGIVSLNSQNDRGGRAERVERDRDELNWTITLRPSRGQDYVRLDMSVTKQVFSSLYPID